VKYCILCRGEYRESIVVCASCHAALVEALDSPEALANPARLLWIGKDSEEFEAVAIALRDGVIPACVEEMVAGIFGGLIQAKSQIHVLSHDFKRALAAAAGAIHSLGRANSEQQACHSCARRCSAFLAACPYCQAALIVEQKHEHEITEKADSQEFSIMKYCPLCDAEYSATHTTCTVCGVELVPEELRGRPLDERQRNERIELVWRGGPGSGQRSRSNLARGGNSPPRSSHQ